MRGVWGVGRRVVGLSGGSSTGSLGVGVWIRRVFGKRYFPFK